MYIDTTLHSYKDNVNTRSPKQIQATSLNEHALLNWPHVNRVKLVFGICYMKVYYILIIYEAIYQNIIVLLFSIAIVFN